VPAGSSFVGRTASNETVPARLVEQGPSRKRGFSSAVIGTGSGAGGRTPPGGADRDNSGQVALGGNSTWGPALAGGGWGRGRMGPRKTP